MKDLESYKTIVYKLWENGKGSRSEAKRQALKSLYAAINKANDAGNEMIEPESHRSLMGLALILSIIAKEAEKILIQYENDIANESASSGGKGKKVSKTKQTRSKTVKKK